MVGGTQGFLLAYVPDHSAGPQTGQFGRSEAEAKLHRFGLVPRTAVASCEAIRGLDHGSLGLELPTDHGRLQGLTQAEALSLLRPKA